MTSNEHAQLVKGLDKLKIGYGQKELDLLGLYLKEIELWNPKYSLVGSTENIIVRHVLDSLGAYKIIKRLNPGSVADVGSGAGFPGIPLALFFRNVQFTLIERSGKRAAFLANASAVLNTGNITVEESDVKRLGGGKTGNIASVRTAGKRFDLVTFRAFSPLSRELLTLLVGDLVSGNNGISGAGPERRFDAGITDTLVLYKGKRSAVDKELKNLIPDNFPVNIYPVSIPFLKEERNIVVIRRSGYLSN
jgi:16S rRNA (guanine527-N7)-methyltransferase